MNRTRDKRNINLGAQALITKVETGDGMLNESPEIRGHMINLKKIMFSYIEESVKSLTTQLISKNQYLCFSGADALNMHFSNKPMHTGFSELVISPKNSDVNSLNYVAEEIMKVLNEKLAEFSTQKSFRLTREILDGCKSSHGYNGKFFTINSDIPDRVRICFTLNADSQEKKMQGFIEIKYNDELRIKPFEKYGIYYLPLSLVESDIKHGTLASGHDDWKSKQITFEQAMKRGGLSISQWTLMSLCKLCFPSLSMRIYNVEDVVKNSINDLFIFAPDSAKKRQLRPIMEEEIKKSKDKAFIITMMTLKTLIERAMILGLLPNGPEIAEILMTPYTETSLREIREIC
tara:strand:- start:3120 stop:4160 length:1041 start_codon:yes stop_codon:yes gene_type:complete